VTANDFALAAFVNACVVHLPSLVVWIVGIAFAIIYWRKHPQISALALIGIALLALVTIVGTIVSLWLPSVLFERGLRAEEIGWAFSLIGIVQSLIGAVAWALILLAVFKERGPRPESAVSGPETSERLP
jgi:hypothetical protein